MASKLIYPEVPPVLNSSYAGLAGLGANWNAGGEGVTPWIDYIRFTIYKPQYDGKAVLESVRNASTDGGSNTKIDIITDVFLYMPANVAISYSAAYNNTKFGVGGVMAAQMLGSSSSEEAAKSLQNAAAGATPETGFKAVSDASNAISSFLGVEGSVSGSDLAAVTQGKIFNPYEEQIFNGISFRAHNFQFKLIARNKKEAETIDGILRTFKTAMLPSRDPTNTLGSVKKAAEDPSKAAKDKTSKDKAGTAGDALTPPFSNTTNRYLTVPARTKVEFVRVQNIRGSLGDVTTAPSIVGLYKMKDCIIDGLQVNYTPDGAYVNTNDGYVPALDMSISLKEVALVTAEDIAKGF